ncbi:MAG: YigZ family protein [Eubacterium sp.]|nr:YigZ family protein [Eubacterium sp.]
MESSSNILYKGGQGEIVEKKSRFIANIFPVKTEEEALEKITAMRKKYYDARHNCFAYIIGENRETERCSDDGEPSGTAGRPMLDVLEGMGVHDVVAVVTRYFGGTLLGTGGLVRAYSAAMKEGLADCVLLSQKTGYRLQILTDYNDVGKLQYLSRTRQLHELSCEYADDVRMELLVPETEIDAVETEITEKTSGKAKLERAEKLQYGLRDGQVVLL